MKLMTGRRIAKELQFYNHHIRDLCHQPRIAILVFYSTDVNNQER